MIPSRSFYYLIIINIARLNFLNINFYNIKVKSLKNQKSFIILLKTSFIKKL